MKRIVANTQKTGSHKNRHSWKKGQSGNPHGAPKRGQSWSEIIKLVSEMTAAEVIKRVGANELAIPFSKMPMDIPLKELVTMRVFSSLLMDPNPGLFNSLQERSEGKVTEHHEISNAPCKIVIEHIGENAGNQNQTFSGADGISAK